MTDTLGSTLFSKQHPVNETNEMTGKETIAQDWRDMKAALNTAEACGSPFVVCLTKAVRLLASIVWHNLNQKLPTAPQADPCGRMARWSLHFFFVRRNPAYLCPEHMHILADAWEAKIKKIVPEMSGDHLCDYLESE